AGSVVVLIANEQFASVARQIDGTICKDASPAGVVAGIVGLAQHAHAGVQHHRLEDRAGRSEIIGRVCAAPGVEAGCHVLAGDGGVACDAGRGHGGAGLGGDAAGGAVEGGGEIAGRGDVGLAPAVGGGAGGAELNGVLSADVSGGDDRDAVLGVFGVV